MMQRNFLPGLLLMLVMCASFGLAQNQSEPVYQVMHIRVKPESIRDFEAVIKNEVLPAFKKSGGRQIQSWTTATFGEAYEYWFVRPLDGLKEFDEPHYLIKALGEKGAEELRMKIRRMSVSQDSFVLTRKNDLSWIPDANYQPRVAVLTRVTVAHGRTDEYEKYVRENTTPLVPKANTKGYRLSKVGLGGNPRQYYSLLLFDSFAEIEKYPALATKLRGAMNLSVAPVGLLTENTSIAVRYLPELSLLPVMQQAAK
jgi:hypothetical protein